ncbi:DUF4386 domain-containing protein [Deinococcus marmoris]|uniref:DUF4386 domain-containing protein n=1 Tax=Deinococcus marmoris TaxID=249408 RepID=A0A1U7NQY2_9DEIO|nr:DUF4386 domain-containing protein [Deinococcus marmoris]OLV15327.1 hypothetical protein BOO71_0015238 [Deinococcus marmoris]
MTLTQPTSSALPSAGRDTPLNLKVYGRVIALLYLLIAGVAGFTHFYLPSRLIVPGDAQATAANLLASPALYRVGSMGGELIILLSEVVLTVMLFMLFRHVNKTVALIATVARLIMTGIHGLNLLNSFFALTLLTGNMSVGAVASGERLALGMLFLDAHRYGFAIGTAFLSLHALALAYLIYTCGFLPRVLGVLFVLAGLGYLIDSAALLLTAQYVSTPPFIALPIAIAEVAFPLWLLVKGVDVPRWRVRLLGA